MSSFKQLDFTGVRGVSIGARESKVRAGQLGKPVAPDADVASFLDSLPDLLGAAALKDLARSVADARRRGRPVLWMMGGHVVKCGAGPYVADLMERGIITAVAMNGAAAIHDFELTMWGHTSEDVEAALERGEFGMTVETASLMNEAVSEGAAAGAGIGESLGRALEKGVPANPAGGVLLTARRLGVPATVHVAIGTDVIHQHPNLDPESVGRGTYIDFKIFAACVSDLEGGVVINAGSAVIMPEVFLKAYSVAKNLGHDLSGFVAANLDFIQHYRPTMNVLRRPVADGGKGIALTGHHEILIPLLACAILQASGEVSR